MNVFHCIYLTLFGDDYILCRNTISNLFNSSYGMLNYHTIADSFLFHWYQREFTENNSQYRTMPHFNHRCYTHILSGRGRLVRLQGQRISRACIPLRNLSSKSIAGMPNIRRIAAPVALPDLLSDHAGHSR